MLSQSDEHRVPQINIGADHQADIPELCNNRIDLHRIPEQLLWDPGINDALDDNEGIVLSLLSFSLEIYFVYILFYLCFVIVYIFAF